MSDGLGNGVVQVLHVALSDHVVFGHLGSLDVNLEVDVVRAQVVVLEVVHHLGFLLGELDLERFESLGSDDPGGDSTGKVLGVEGSEGNVFPNLQVTARPIVKKGVSENVVLGIVDLDRLTHLVSSSNDGSHLELKIESVALRPRRSSNLSLTGRRSNLTLRSADLSSINDDRGSTSMVTNG